MADPITIGAGIKTGADLLSGFFSHLGGRGQRKRARGEFEDFLQQFQADRQRLLGLEDQDLIDPFAATDFARRRAGEQREGLVSSFNTQGLDISQPLIRGALAESSGKGFQDTLLEFLLRNAQAKFNRRGRTAETLFGSSERQLGATRDLAFG